jgi:hypothetical protein
LEWGSSSETVGQILGSFEFASKNRHGNRIEYRSDRTLSCIFDKTSGGLLELSCTSGKATLAIDGIEINNKNPAAVVEKLIQIDRRVFQGGGSIVFLGLGLSLTGFIPEDGEIQATSAFAGGRWDALIRSMKPFRQ